LDRRWLFADQLGPHFLDAEDQKVLLVMSRAVFRRRRFHRQKAHLVLSALRHRAAELGPQAVYLETETFAEAVVQLDEPVTVCAPTSYAARRLVGRLPKVAVVPERGFLTTAPEFHRWASGRSGRLLLEDFYRDVRRRHGIGMTGDEPVGGRWNFDADNRQPPPRGAATLAQVGVPEPSWPVEDDIDAQVRDDLDRWEREGVVSFVGRDGPRWAAATRSEALGVLDDFVAHRLAAFGPYEDAMLAADGTMAHSTLSVPLNLGLLDPAECVTAVERAYQEGRVPWASVEGFLRQLIGWRDYVWNLYWYLGEDYRHRNALNAHRPLPTWWLELDADAVDARCLSWALRAVRDRGWTHHIPRLMVLGSYALQRGLDPAAVTDWFHRSFLDGYDWVMVPNVIGMSQYADGGVMATKPYTSGGAYIHRMSDLCRGCRYRPSHRTGSQACPFTGGYWAFLSAVAPKLAGNHRMAQPLAGLRRLADLDEVLDAEEARGTNAP
jgi:deoxyribodipyrimidine photolyase-related protein